MAVGYPLTGKFVFTFGELKVDMDSRVLSMTGTPVPGIFMHILNDCEVY